MFNWLTKKTPITTKPSESKTLCDVNNGQNVRIDCLQGKELDCQRLREMGFCEQAEVQKIADNGALICRVCDSKVIISQDLAKNIYVSDYPKKGDSPVTQIAILSDLKQGQKGIIHDFIEENDTCARLEEMGLTPGETVEVIRYAPLGDPIEIKIRGYLLSLRKQEAQLIQVQI